MITPLYNVKLINTGTGQEVYNENLPFYKTEPNDENIIGFVKLIRPDTLFDLIQTTFVGNLDSGGRLIKQ